MFSDALVALCVTGTVLLVGLRWQRIRALVSRAGLRRFGGWASGQARLAGWRAWLQRAAQRAGVADAASIERIAAVQALSVCALPICLASAAALGAWLPLLPPVAGVILPIVWLRDRAKQRALALSRELPWTLDLLTLAVEVGMDFNVAVARAVERGRGGVLHDELAAVVRELRVGASRQDALEALRWRTGHPALGRFCTAVIQAERLGTPLARVLRAQSADLRIARCQRAEQLAGEAPVKLLMPLLACIFPTVFLVLLGPIAFSLLAGGGVP
jgi:tight adherence protein C